MSAECLPACLPERATTRRGNFATVKWGFKGERIAGRRRKEKEKEKKKTAPTHSKFLKLFEHC